jgi:hypothetical protein
MGNNTEHGPAIAFYDNLAMLAYLGTKPRPRIECLCGFITGRGHECWMTAGEEFDEHLKIVHRRSAIRADRESGPGRAD